MRAITVDLSSIPDMTPENAQQQNSGKMKAFVTVTPGLESMLVHDINLKLKIPAREMKKDKGLKC